MTFLELAEKRYSCRSISDRPVEEEKIAKILRSAQLAPTACNLQPFKIWVIDKEADIEKIKMTGHLYQSVPSSIDFKYYFKSVTYSIPLATSINVATSTLFE